MTREIVTVLFFLDFYLFIHERHREKEREREEGEEAGSMQGAPCGIRSWVSRIMPWAEVGAKPLSHQGCPVTVLLSLTKKELACFKGNGAD